MSDEDDWLEKFLAPDLDREAALFDEMIRPAEDCVDHYRRLEKELGADAPQEAADWLIDEAAPVADLLVDGAAICLVGISHWIERRAKTRLRTKQGRTGTSKVRKLKFEALVDEFGKVGVDLKSMQQYPAVDSLRRFANAWKHDPLDHARARAHLHDEDARRRLALAAGLDADGSGKSAAPRSGKSAVSRKGGEG